MSDSVFTIFSKYQAKSTQLPGRGFQATRQHGKCIHISYYTQHTFLWQQISHTYSK